MKKILILFIFISFLAFRKNDEIRVRIIANSNSYNDLLIKDEIKAIVCDFLDAKCDNIKDYIINNLEELNNKLNKIDDCFISFENHIFMNKTYNDYRLNNNEYLTLLIKIKDALGDNWWTTLYLDNKTSTIKYKSFILERIKNDS